MFQDISSKKNFFKFFQTDRKILSNHQIMLFIHWNLYFLLHCYILKLFSMEIGWFLADGWKPKKSVWKPTAEKPALCKRYTQVMLSLTLQLVRPARKRPSLWTKSASNTCTPQPDCTRSPLPGTVSPATRTRSSQSSSFWESSSPRLCLTTGWSTSLSPHPSTPGSCTGNSRSHPLGGTSTTLTPPSLQPSLSLRYYVKHEHSELLRLQNVVFSS